MNDRKRFRRKIEVEFFVDARDDEHANEIADRLAADITRRLVGLGLDCAGANPPVADCPMKASAR